MLQCHGSRRIGRVCALLGGAPRCPRCESHVIASCVVVRAACVYVWQSGEHQFIGKFVTSVDELLRAGRNSGGPEAGKGFTLQSSADPKVRVGGGSPGVLSADAAYAVAVPASDARRGGVFVGVQKSHAAGTIIVTHSSVETRASFADYISGGMQLQLMVAIDVRRSLSCRIVSNSVVSCPVLSCPVLSCPVLSCPVVVSDVVVRFALQYTASNGAPSTPSSLHHINSFAPNEYQMAIQTVGEILMVGGVLPVRA